MSTNLAIVEPDVDERNPEQDLATFQQTHVVADITNTETEAQALIFITECKAAGKRLDEIRTKKVEPHLTEQRRINGLYNPVIEAFERLWRGVDAKVSAYKKRRDAEIAEANRLAIAKAEQERAERERKEREAREEAERLRREAERLAKEEADREFQAEMERLALEQKAKDEAAAAEAARKAGKIAEARAAEQRAAEAKAEEERQVRYAEAARQAAEAERARLEKAAIKQDAKADIAATAATMVSPVIQVAAPKTIELQTGAKATGKKQDIWLFANGMPIDGEYYGDDPRIKDIPLRYLKLDVKKLGKDVMNGVPIAGTKRDWKYVTAAGRTK